MDIVKELRGGAEDPMWDAHCEMPKRVAKAAADRIEQLEAALRYARPIIVRWCYTQGNNPQFIVDTTKPVDAALLGES